MLLSSLIYTMIFSVAKAFQMEMPKIASLGQACYREEYMS